MLKFSRLDWGKFSLLTFTAPFIYLSAIFFIQPHVNQPLSYLIVYFLLACITLLLIFLVNRILKKEDNSHKDVLDNLDDTIAVLDENNNLLYVNKALSKNKENLLSLEKHIKLLREKFGEEKNHLEEKKNNENDEIRQLYSTTKTFNNAQRKKHQLIQTTDITHAVTIIKQQSEKDKTRLERIIDASEECIWEWNVQTNEARLNKQWEIMAGLKQSDNAFAEFSDAIYEDDKEMVHQALENLVENNIPFNIEFRLNRPDGSTIWLWDRGRISEYDEQGNPLWVVGITLEVTESKQSQLKIESLAYYDQLTGLPNRRLMEKQLNKLIETPSPTTSYSALLFIDLDRFKLLNDSFGHLMGDKLLKTIASRLNHINTKNSTIARFGGDEFIILLSNLHSEHAHATQLTRQFADTIVAEISKQVNLRNEVLDVEIDYCITASLGGIIFNANTVNSDEIQQLADMAMYRTKAAGGNAAIIFDLEMQNELRKTSELSLAMLNSLVDKEFCIYLQPRLNRNEELIGAEALIRWYHPTLGILEPNSFIELAEESGFILHIGRYVVEQACIQLQRWQANEMTKHLQLSVNLSSKQIIQGSFCQDLIEIVEAYNIEQSKLILEVTESMLIPDIKDATEKLTQLRAYGLSISLDDFGTGFSSLNYLRAFPIDELKIDRSFVMDVESSEQAKIMVKSIIELASNLNLNIVAEGVETRNQIEVLRELGVHIYQGFYFSKPIPTAEFYAKYGLMQ